MIDVFRTDILTLLAPTGDNTRVSFFRTPGTTYLCYSLMVSPNVYAVLPPHLSLQVYLSSDDC